MSRYAVAVAAMAMFGCSVSSAAAKSPSWLQCSEKDVAVAGAPAGSPGWVINGQLCRKRGTRPTTVQLLVHGGTYNRTYWDLSYRPSIYSYVRRAVAAGYATFAIDHLGVGSSSRPPSSEVHLNSVVDTISEVIARLRAGEIDGTRFERVVWVSQSYGSVLGWIEASRHHDVDAFVITGMLHFQKPSTLIPPVPAAQDDPERWGSFDPGYLTLTDSLRRELFYYLPTTEPAVLARDRELKDTITATEFVEVFPLLSDPNPATAPSRSIRVPTLLLVGDHDNSFCLPPDGLTCTISTIRNNEDPFYAPEARLDIRMIPQTGHNLTLHRTAPLSAAMTLNWLASVAPS